MYDLAAAPPKPGSIREVVFLMIQMRRELMRFQETMVVVQAIRDEESGDATQKAFESYRNTLMPYLKKQLDEERKQVIKALRDEAGKGPLKVAPILSPAMARSKLRHELSKARSAARYGSGKKWTIQ